MESRIITETEAYIGAHDLASHAAKGRTKRNEAMFGELRTFYVYFVYGMHWMMNVVTGAVEYPAAVLIRGVQDIDGPARLIKAMGVSGSLNGKLANEKSGSGSPVEHGQSDDIVQSARIGVALCRSGVGEEALSVHSCKRMMERSN